MTTVFLDFDGVLVGDRFLRAQANHSTERRLFDPANLAELDRLCSACDVQRIVISSTWRLGRSVAQLAALLESEGLGCATLVHDVTPDLGLGGASVRRLEIQDWIDRHQPARAIVLDDLDLGALAAATVWPVRVPAYSGLTASLVDDLLARLTRQRGDPQTPRETAGVSRRRPMFKPGSQDQ
jgi:hypothetical protein